MGTDFGPNPESRRDQRLQFLTLLAAQEGEGWVYVPYLQRLGCSYSLLRFSFLPVPFCWVLRFMFAWVLRSFSARFHFC